MLLKCHNVIRNNDKLSPEAAFDEISKILFMKIRYERERCKLFVRFQDGDEYVYVGVPEDVHRSFAHAPSKAHFFTAEIRDRYPFNRLNA